MRVRQPFPVPHRLLLPIWSDVLGVLLFITVAAAASACAKPAVSGTRDAPAPEPIEAVELLPPEVDLSGQWYTGTGAEPAVPRIVHHPSCTHNPAAWVLEQRGNVIKAWSFAESYNQGVVPPGPGPAVVRPAPGTISGVQVVIEDREIRYVLRYDRESEHLRGTRNGVPFWAVRQVVVRSGLCPGVP